jgi:hypothetical protein
MWLEIVTQFPRAPWPRRMARAAQAAVGASLLFAGVSVLAVSTLFTGLVLLNNDQAHRPSKVANVVMLVLVMVAAAMAMLVGRRLLRGRRSLVLFLRRFGFQGASATVTYAVLSAIGRRFRLVTLDDASITGVGVRSLGAWSRARWLTAIALLVVLALGVHGYLYELPQVISSTMKDAADQAPKSGGISAAIGGIIGGIIAAIVVGALLVVSVLTLIFATVGYTAFTFVTWLSVRRAEGDKALEVKTEEAVAPAVARLQRRLGGWLSPRLVVMRCADVAWRNLVTTLAQRAELVLIDISDPSEHLIWEIETLRAVQGAKFLLIGDRERVEGLIHGTRVLDARTAQALVSHLTGHKVLVYEAKRQPAVREFARALRDGLEHAGSRP